MAEQMERGVRVPRPPQARPYYEDLGKAHDDLLRCHQCNRLVTYDSMFGNGRPGTTRCCGSRRVDEVRGLRFFEWLKIRIGLIRFAHRDKFLKEFSFFSTSKPEPRR